MCYSTCFDLEDTSLELDMFFFRMARFVLRRRSGLQTILAPRC